MKTNWASDHRLGGSTCPFRRLLLLAQPASLSTCSLHARDDEMGAVEEKEVRAWEKASRWDKCGWERRSGFIKHCEMGQVIKVTRCFEEDGAMPKEQMGGGRGYQHFHPHF